MTDPEKTKIQVRKPAGYLEVPIEAKLPNGGRAAVTESGKPTMTSPDPNGPRPLAIKSIEDAKDPSGGLIEAIQTVFRVVTAKIAHHEREAQRLREALAPFASHARQSAAPQPQSDGATVEALLRIADELNKGEQQ